MQAGYRVGQSFASPDLFKGCLIFSWTRVQLGCRQVLPSEELGGVQTPPWPSRGTWSGRDALVCHTVCLECVQRIQKKATFA